MPNRIVINGKEVTNPVARAVIGFLAVAFALGIVVLVCLLVLPLVGITVGVSLGFAGIVLLVVAVLVPVVMIAAGLLGAVVAPFRALADVLARRRGKLTKQD